MRGREKDVSGGVKRDIRMDMREVMKMMGTMEVMGMGTGMEMTETRITMTKTMRTRILFPALNQTVYLLERPHTR